MEFVDEEEIQLIVVRADLKDKTVLYVRESITDQNRYSYHWQTRTGKLIVRWDNAPHYSQIKTHPLYKHVKIQDKVEASDEVSLGSVLEFIEKEMKTRGK